MQQKEVVVVPAPIRCMRVKTRKTDGHIHGTVRLDSPENCKSGGITRACIHYGTGRKFANFVLIFCSLFDIFQDQSSRLLILNLPPSLLSSPRLKIICNTSQNQQEGMRLRQVFPRRQTCLQEVHARAAEAAVRHVGVDVRHLYFVIR